MRRVMVIGGPGAGKTTFAFALGRLTGLPVTSLDTLYWLPGWTQRPPVEGDRLAREAASGDAWIIEGNYTATFPERLRRADTLVFIDIGTARRLVRVVLRTLRDHGRVRAHMAEGCPERFDRDFLKWVANYRRTGRRRALAAIAAPSPRLRVVHLRSPAAARRFLAGFDGAMPGWSGARTDTGPDLT